MSRIGFPIVSETYETTYTKATDMYMSIVRPTSAPIGQHSVFRITDVHKKHCMFSQKSKSGQVISMEEYLSLAFHLRKIVCSCKVFSGENRTNSYGEDCL